MSECIDAIHLTVEVARRGPELGPAFADAMNVWNGAFQAAGVLAGIDEAAGALRVILESCRTLTGALTESLAGGQ